jgi:hypothetical protein
MLILIALGTGIATLLSLYSGMRKPASQRR